MKALQRNLGVTLHELAIRTNCRHDDLRNPRQSGFRQLIWNTPLRNDPAPIMGGEMSIIKRSLQHSIPVSIFK